MNATGYSSSCAGGGFRAPSSALPLGAVSKADPLKITPVVVDSTLMQSLLAVSHAQTPDQLVHSNVAGFILVTEVDVTRGTVTYLSPTAGQLPGRYLLQGSQKIILD
jgi:polyribonucleotide 5'-hydroxyl-kinase